MSIRVRNMVGARNNAIANQFIMEDETNNVITFQSYKSTIAEYSTDCNGRKLVIHSDWDYSKTTMKYFKQFINEYTLFRYETKEKFLKMAMQDSRIMFK